MDNVLVWIANLPWQVWFGIYVIPAIIYNAVAMTFDRTSDGTEHVIASLIWPLSLPFFLVCLILEARNAS